MHSEWKSGHHRDSFFWGEKRGSVPEKVGSTHGLSRLSELPFVARNREWRGFRREVKTFHDGRNREPLTIDGIYLSRLGIAFHDPSEYAIIRPGAAWIAPRSSRSSIATGFAL